MYSRTFAPGETVRVEREARIVEQVPHNPYWYLVEYADGAQEQVYVERLHLIADRARVLQEAGNTDIKIISSRLTAAGAIDLLQWLQGHEDELRAAIRAPVTQAEEATALDG